MRRLLAAVAVLSLVAAGGCGDGDDPPPPTTVVTAPTTTLAQGDAQGIACLNHSTEALQLLNDFNLASRGVVAPDP
ncbi:MAG TPA: hypothetical protein VF244_01150, partial [Acidimicrobiales bacterium]